MIKQEQFVDALKAELARRFAGYRYRLSNPSERDEMAESMEQCRFDMRLRAYYGMAVMEGIEIGRAQILEEQADERAKRRRKAAKKRRAKA